MLTCLTDPTYGVIELTIDGAATRAEYELAVAEMDGAIAHYGKLNLIEIVKHIGPIDSSIWWLDVKWAYHHIKDVARCAVVTDKGWIGPVSRAVGAVVAAEIRVFPLAELEAARDWVRGR